PSVVTSALFPTLTTDIAQGRSQALSSHYASGTQLVMYLASLPAVLLIFYGHDAIRLMTSPAVADSASPPPPTPRRGPPVFVGGASLGGSELATPGMIWGGALGIVGVVGYLLLGFRCLNKDLRRNVRIQLRRESTHETLPVA